MTTTYPTSGAVRPDDLQGRLRDGRIQVVDVRSPGEFAAAHIAESYNIPLDAIPSVGRELRDAHVDPLVLVCQSGARARQAESLLRAAGVESARVLDGGLNAWEAAGLPVERGRGTWSIERQVRAIAGGLVLAGAVGSIVAWRPLVYLSAAVGGGLLYAGVSDNCTMAKILLRLPFNQAHRADVADVVDIVERLKSSSRAASPR